MLLFEEKSSTNFNLSKLSEFVHKEELQKLLNILHTKSEFFVLLSGYAGCGKTTILQKLYQEITSQGKKVIFVSAWMINYNDNKFQTSSLNLEDAIIIVDGIDESPSSNHILTFLKRFKKVYVSVRNPTSHSTVFSHNLTIESNCFTDHIEVNTLSLNSLYKLRFEQYIRELKLYDDKVTVNNLNEQFGNFTSKDVIPDINHFIDNNDLLYDTIVKLGPEGTQGYKLGEGVFLNSPELFMSDKPDMVIPPEIVTDFTSLLSRVAQNPSIIHKCTHREFEELVCELLDKKGYKVNLTQPTRDGGKDIIVVENDLLGAFLIYVECKKFAPNNPVGVSLVRELYGTVSADRATAGLLVTTSYFTEDAIKFKNQVKHQLELMDYVRLISEIQKSFKS